MSQERELINLSPKSEGEIQEALAKEKAEFIAKAAVMLDRGWTNARVNVELPPEIYGEWVHDSATEVARMRSLGFKDDTEFATKSALHNDGTGIPKIGDVRFMICDRWKYEILQKMKADRANRNFKSKHVESPDFNTDVVPVSDKGVNQHIKDGRGLATSITEDGPTKSQEHMNQPQPNAWDGSGKRF